MKVLHITTIDTGGAYKGALRLHESMQHCGISSRLLVRTKNFPESPVTEAFSSIVGRIVSKTKNAVNLLYKKGEIHGDILGTDLSRNRYVKDADVIILHWINSFLSPKDIAGLCNLGKPVLWILHDMWPFTGGCHYDRYCNRYEQTCGCCPLLQSNKHNDITHRNHDIKETLFRDMPVTVIGPSEWIVGCAARSSILQGKNIMYIPNTLDVAKYTPVPDRPALQQKYNIVSDKKIILFGAADKGIENPMKGFDFLVKALRKLSPEKYALAIFGQASLPIVGLEEFDIYTLGYITDENKLREIYNLADVFVNPSLQEAFGYTVCEAMACGTPVTAFAVGGNQEQITHMQSGYLAKYQDVDDLARGIEYCAKHTEQLGIRAHESAQRYSYDVIGSKYKDLCDNLTIIYR